MGSRLDGGPGGDRHQKARSAAARGPGWVGVRGEHKGSPGPRAHRRARYVLHCARPSSPRPYCSKVTILGSLEP